ncbi:unnamed protein product, partial [Protopolystoma xenopodis]
HDCKQPDAGEICYNVSAEDILARNKTGAYSDADVRMRITMTKQRSPTWVADDERFSDNSKKLVRLPSSSLTRAIAEAARQLSDSKVVLQIS